MSYSPPGAKGGGAARHTGGAVRVCSSGEPPPRPYLMPTCVLRATYRVSCPEVETTCGSGGRVAEISASRKLVHRGNKFISEEYRSFQIYSAGVISPPPPNNYDLDCRKNGVKKVVRRRKKCAVFRQLNTVP